MNWCQHPTTPRWSCTYVCEWWRNTHRFWAIWNRPHCWLSRQSQNTRDFILREIPIIFGLIPWTCQWESSKIQGGITFPCRHYQETVLKLAIVINIIFFIMRRWILNYTASANIIFISFQMTALPSKKNVHEWIEKQTDVNNPQGPDYIWLAGTCTPKLSICPNNPFHGLHQQSVGSPTCETNNPLLPWAYTKWVCMAVWPTPCNLMPISWLVPCYAEPRSALACIDAAHWSLPIIAALIR